MSTVQDFDATFNEVVQAKRLSQSKMTKLTELALKLMNQDTQLVSSMYRSHKMLPASCKISSLYVFDALARAARQQVIKHNLSERQATGNCATFLSKVAGVLEGLFQDLLATGPPEAKEKTRKIYDIWVKGSTFPPDILSRLLDVVSGKDKVTEVNTSVTPDPRIISQMNSTIPPQSPVASTSTNTQATLLALLTQAASHQVPQTTANTAVTNAAPLDPAQIAILQYLQAASVNNNAAASPTPPTTVESSDTRAPKNATDRQMSNSPVPPVEHNHCIRQGNRRDYRSPPQNGRSYERDHDKRSHSYKESRGGSRRRGRWNRWDEREPLSQRELPETGQSPRSGGRSRSHSPEGRTYKGPALVHPSSSQRQASPSRSRYHDDSSTSYPTNGSSRKDEFGRDLRSPSPSDSPDPGPTSNPHSSTSPDTPIAHRFSKSEFSSTSNDQMSRSSIAANTFPKEPDASETSHESSSKTGQQFEKQNFDISTFDPTSPASWEAMGKTWEIMNGYQPSTEELMQFVMMSQLQSKNWQQGDNLNAYNDDQGRAGGRGQRGNSRVNHHEWANDGMNSGSTDAVVLGGGEMEIDESAEGESPQKQDLSNSGARLGGKMQKVGDRWVFVRNDTGVQ